MVTTSLALTSTRRSDKIENMRKSKLFPAAMGTGARYTCNLWHNISSITEMVRHLGWEPLATRRRNMRLCVMYKIANTVVGDPWAEWLTTPKRVMRGFHAWKYIPIYSQHNFYKFSFLSRTIIDWNILSPHSVDSPSIDTFRARMTKN